MSLYQTLSGRPKRSSALTPSERRRERSRKRRPGRALDSDEEEEEEYCPGNGGEEEGSAESEAETVVTPARKKVAISHFSLCVSVDERALLSNPCAYSSVYFISDVEIIKNG